MTRRRSDRCLISWYALGSDFAWIDWAWSVDVSNTIDSTYAFLGYTEAMAYIGHVTLLLATIVMRLYSFI